MMNKTQSRHVGMLITARERITNDDVDKAWTPTHAKALNKILSEIDEFLTQTRYI